MKKLLILFLSICLLQSYAQVNNPYLISRRNAAAELPYNPALKPFYHGVASGDPLQDRVIIWTRVTPQTDGMITVNWEMASDTLFSTVVKSGNFQTDNTRDYTVKVDVTGLQSGTTYYFRFSALGKTSIIGKTKTTPQDSDAPDRLKFGVVSCSNYEGGYFNAYGRLSEKKDLDALLFLGDYIYEYQAGGYRNAGLKDTNRIVEPLNEILTESDYRIRYSLYHLDPDLLKAHQQHAFISIWDDHESANDSYNDGAENHTEGKEGSWITRKAIAEKVYYEWMPIRNLSNGKMYRTVTYGNLAELIMLDTRMDNRQKQPVHFDDASVLTNKIMSDEQFSWFTTELKSSKAKWKVIGNQVLFSSFYVGFAAGLGDGKPDPTNIDSIRPTEDNFVDAWKGYLGQRNPIIDSLKKNAVQNVVFVTGDSHCSWAFDVTKTPVQYPLPAFSYIPQPNPYNSKTGEGYDPATGKGSYAVEFGTPSISSANFDEVIGLQTATLFQGLINNPIPYAGNANYNPHLKYTDLINHGYFILDVQPDSVQADFYYVPSVTAKNTTISRARGASVLDKISSIHSTKVAEAAPKKMQDIPAPAFPTMLTSTLGTKNGAEIISLYPNPADNVIMLNFGLLNTSQIEIRINDQRGRTVKVLTRSTSLGAGNYEMDYNISDLQPGIYFLSINYDGTAVNRKLIVK